MSDEEAATLCGIAYSALLFLPHQTQSRLSLQSSMACLRDEIARLRGRDPEDVQNEFERCAS